MRLEFESNVSSVPFSENGFAENASETASAQTSELLREGIKAAQSGNRAEARHLLLRVTETEPHNENAWLWLASISEYPEELLIFLNNVLDVNPDNARAQEWMKQTKSLLAKTFVQRGIDASKENQSDFAKQCFYQAAAHDDTNEMAWLWLASVSNSVEEKVVHLNKAISINPENEDAQTALKAVHQEMADTLLQKAIAAADEGDTLTAGEFLKEVLQKSPEMEDAWMLKAKIAADTSEKIRYYEKVLELNAENETAQGELAKIDKELTKALLENAKSAAFAGDSQSANQMLAEVLEKSPELEDAWLLKSHLALGFDEKMNCFERVLELNPENESAKSGLNTLRAFMPKIEAGKDEYSQMAEEFAEEASAESDFEKPEESEESEVFAEENHQPEAVLFQDFSETAKEDQISYQETESAETEFDYQAAEFDYQANEESNPAENQIHEESNAPQQNETSQPSPNFYQFDADEDAEKDWAIHITDSVFAPVKTEQVNEAETLQTEFAEEKTESAEVKYVDFGLDIEDEPYAASENAETYAQANETEVFAALPYFEEKQEIVRFDAVSAEDSEPQTEIAAAESFQPETFEHQPTQFFEKPASDLYYEEFSFQTAAPAAIEEAATVNEEVFEPAVVETAPLQEFAPVQEFSPVQESTPAPIEEYSFFSNETVESNFNEMNFTETAAEKEEAESSHEVLFAEENLSPAAQESYVHSEELRTESAPETFPEVHKTAAHAQPEGFHCPFCNVENDAHAFSCSSCSAVLSLSDLEMLLANQNADKEVLRQTLNRMENEKEGRTFEEYELMFLGIGHINLKNLRQGFSYLQKASQLNPNNVLLASQVNALAIRIDEIERQEAVHDSMPKGRTILVVDDSPTVRKLISGKLEKSGHEVFCAVDGMDALAKLEEVVPDLILLDITMPRMDGYQVCKLIRNNPATKDLPIVMISGKDGFFDKVRGRMAGTTGYITKPFGPETLMKALDVYIKPNEEPNLDHSISPEN